MKRLAGTSKRKRNCSSQRRGRTCCAPGGVVRRTRAPARRAPARPSQSRALKQSKSSRSARAAALAKASDSGSPRAAAGQRVEARERLGFAVGVEGLVARDPAVGVEHREQQELPLEGAAAGAVGAGMRPAQQDRASGSSASTSSTRGEVDAVGELDAAREGARRTRRRRARTGAAGGGRRTRRRGRAPPPRRLRDRPAPPRRRPPAPSPRRARARGRRAAARRSARTGARWRRRDARRAKTSTRWAAPSRRRPRSEHDARRARRRRRRSGRRVAPVERDACGEQRERLAERRERFLRQLGGSRPRRPRGTIASTVAAVRRAGRVVDHLELVGAERAR